VIGIGALCYAIYMTLVPLVGVTAPGRILRLDTNYSSKSHKEYYTARYRYVYNDAAYSGSSSISFDDYRTWSVGRTVHIQFMPIAPRLGARLIEGTGSDRFAGAFL